MLDLEKKTDMKIDEVQSDTRKARLTILPCVRITLGQNIQETFLLIVNK